MIPKALSNACFACVTWTRDWLKVPDISMLCFGPEKGEIPEHVNGVRCENPRAEMSAYIEEHFPTWRNQYPINWNGHWKKERQGFISPSAVIYDCVEMGKDVYVGANVVIGEPGFSFDRIDGECRRFPHLGTVIIGDDVEICPGACIARGSLKDTVLERGVKVDQLCHIAHNCFIGEDSVLTAGVNLGGSVIIGKRAWLGLGAAVKDGVSIGDDSIIGIGSVVINDVPEGVVVAGNPARVIGQNDGYEFDHNRGLHVCRDSNAS